MTAGDMYTVIGASMVQGETGDGGPATAAELSYPVSVAFDATGNMLIPDPVDSKIREVFASTTQLLGTTPGGTGITVNQADGSQVTFYPQSGGTCTAPYTAAGGSGYCTLPQDTSASLTYNSGAGTYTYTPAAGSTSYTYNSTTGALKSAADTAGNTLTLTASTPAPGSGHCPATASTCTTITAASSRTLVLGYSSAGMVTSVTDPLANRWTYAYTGSQLTTVTDPMANVTTYTYGAGSTGNPQLTSDLLTITNPNGQPGGSAAGKKTVNIYDTQGRVTTQTDPMGYQTTFNYCASAAAGNCLNPATGTGLVTVSDPDGNKTVYNYVQGTLAAQSEFTGSTLTSETDDQPNTGNGTLLDVSTADGDGNASVSTYDSSGDTTSTTSAGPNGTTAVMTDGFTTALLLQNCASTADTSSSVTCSLNPGPAPVAPGGTITPPGSAPPPGLTYTLYDTDGNQLYQTTGVYQPGASTASYSQTSYQLFKGNSVTLHGTTITCATVPPSVSLPCAKVNADAAVTQLAYNSSGDLISSSTPDGNGSEAAWTTYLYNADGEQTSAVAPDGNLSGATAGNYTTVTGYNSDGAKTSVAQGAGPGATITARTTSYGYDANGNQTTVKDPRGYTTTNTYNADDKQTVVTDPDNQSVLTCYDGDGNAAQTVPASGVAAGSLTAASCPVAYPGGYSTRLSSQSTVDTYNAVGKTTQETTPAPAGHSGYETTTYAYDGNGNVTTATTPAVSNTGPSVVTADTYNPDGTLATQTTGYGTSAAATASYCYDPAGNKTAAVAPDGNATGTAPCETASPWVVSSSAHPAQAAFQTAYSFDSAGEAVSITTPATSAAPSGGTTTVTYDPVGNKLTSKDLNGVTATWTYTPLNRAATASYSGSSAHAVSYTYDASGNMTAMTDATGSSSEIWDSFGELTTVKNGAGKTTAYGYNPDGQVTGITYPLPVTATWAATSTVSYGYDNADELASATDFNSRKISIGSTADDLPNSVALGPTGDTIGTSYDPTGAPSSITLSNGSSTLQSFSYSDAPSGNVLTETDTPAGTYSSTSYTYDGQGRVASMIQSSTSSYGFDASSNLSHLPSGATTSYDNAGELTSSALSGTTTSYTYNAVGQRLSAKQGSTTTSSATWNGADALTTYTDSAAAMSGATYDGNGLRAAATTTPAGGSAVSQSYVWDIQGDSPQVIMDNSNAYIYTSGPGPAEQVNLSTGVPAYLITDSLGSVRGAVSSSGTLAGTSAYDAWGTPEPTAGLASVTPFGYAGGYTDTDGLIYLQSRYYDTATGQFLSADPLAAQTLQTYAYANGDPVSEIDPTGTDGYVRWTVVKATQLAPRIGSWHDCVWFDWRDNIDEAYCQKSTSVTTQVTGSLEINIAKIFSSIGLSVSVSRTNETAQGGYVFRKTGRVGWIQWAVVQPVYYVNQRKWIGGSRGGGIHWVPLNIHAYATIYTSGGSTMTFRFVQCKKVPKRDVRAC